jgi:hypothetical protein
MKKAALAVICLAMLLNGCASGHGDADAGPDLGGGFYDGVNFDAGEVNPSPGSFYYLADTKVGEATPKQRLATIPITRVERPGQWLETRAGENRESYDNARPLSFVSQIGASRRPLSRLCRSGAARRPPTLCHLAQQWRFSRGRRLMLERLSRDGAPSRHR